MKKITAIIIAAFLVFALSACTKAAGERVSKSLNNAQNQSEKEVIVATRAATEPIAEPATEPSTAYIESENADNTNINTPDLVESATKETESKQNNISPSEFSSTQNPQIDLISRDKSIAIALENAGLTRSSVYDLEAELDRERNATIWEVDFETREYEYSYIINAENEKIINHRITPQSDKPKYTEIQTEPVAKTEPTSAPSTSTELITREQATEIALKHANLTKSSVYDLEAEFDKEKNLTIWEVDFETQEYEYSYEINAENGNIIHCEKERND